MNDPGAPPPQQRPQPVTHPRPHTQRVDAAPAAAGSLPPHRPPRPGAHAGMGPPSTPLTRMQTRVNSAIQVLDRRSGGVASAEETLGGVRKAQEALRALLPPQERMAFDRQVAAQVLRLMRTTVERLYAAACDEAAKSEALKMSDAVYSALSETMTGGTLRQLRKLVVPQQSPQEPPQQAIVPTLTAAAPASLVSLQTNKVPTPLVKRKQPEQANHQQQQQPRGDEPEEAGKVRSRAASAAQATTTHARIPVVCIPHTQAAPTKHASKQAVGCVGVGGEQPPHSCRLPRS